MKQLLGKIYTDEEYDALFDGLVEKIENQRKIANHQKNKIHKFISTLSDEKVDHLFIKFLKWEMEYQEFWYSKNIETQSTAFGILMDYIEERAEKIEDLDSDNFLQKSFFYKGYVFKLFVGQGAFWRVLKDGKIVFQSA